MASDGSTGRTYTSTLRDAGALSNLSIGTVARNSQLSTSDELSRFVEVQYGILTDPDVCGWNKMVAENGRASCLAAAAAATSMSMGFRVHSLVSGLPSSLPLSLLPPTATREEKLEAMLTHVREEAAALGGSASAIDVVSDAICDCGTSDPLDPSASLCPSYVGEHPEDCELSNVYSDSSEAGVKVYLRKNALFPIVPDYIGQALKEAKNAMPTAKVGYTDKAFAAETGLESERSSMVHELVRQLIIQGIPIDYVGCEENIPISYDYYDWLSGDQDGIGTYFECVADNIVRYTALDVKFHFHSLAVGKVSAGDEWSVDSDAAQSRLLSGLVRVCKVNNATCEVLQFAGPADEWAAGYESMSAFVFDSSLQPKPAFGKIMSELDPLYAEAFGCHSETSGRCAVDSDCCFPADKCYMQNLYDSFCLPACPTEVDWACDSGGGVDSATGGSVMEKALMSVGLIVAVGLCCLTAKNLFVQVKADRKRKQEKRAKQKLEDEKHKLTNDEINQDRREIDHAMAEFEDDDDVEASDDESATNPIRGGGNDRL